MALENRPWKPDKPGFYMTDAFTDHAVELIDQYGRKPDPYFLYLAYTAPHWPLHAWPKDIAKYRGKYRKGWDELRQERHARQIDGGIVQARWGITPRDPEVPEWAKVENKDDEDLRMAVYAAQIDRLDQNIGRVLHKVRELGQEEDTLILFLADNGGCAEERIKGEKPVPAGPAESFTSYGRPWANASNTPFRLYKHWVHEGGIATPFIAHWPAVIPKGGTLDHDRAHIIDLAATVLDVAGVAHPDKYQGRLVLPLEGKSLRAAFEGKPRQLHDAIFWEHTGNRAVWQAGWKLVSRFPDRWELYNLAADRTEMHDLASSQPERVTALKASYEAWAKRCNVVPWDQTPAGRAGNRG
jgi:arylsulfatase